MKAGDVVLTRFSYSDLSGAKIRPALVLSGEKFSEQTKLVIVAAISSRPIRNSYEILIEDWKNSGLHCKSKVCIGKLLTVNVGLLTKIGRLNKKILPGQLIYLILFFYNLITMMQETNLLFYIQMVGFLHYFLERRMPMDWYIELDHCNNLAGLESITKGCKKCSLCKEAKQVVFGKGSQNASIMLVGEAPGADEDNQGIPFVGKAGQLLDKILTSAGINDVYITNIAKCRPPENRLPTERRS